MSIRMRHRVLLVCAIVLLSACGGGGDSAPAQNTPPAQTAPASVTVIGTAASGAPLAGATIRLRCIGAEFSASANTDGEFRIEGVPALIAPCLLQAALAQSVFVAPVPVLGAGILTVNATPLTHLLSSRLLGQSAELVFESADSATLARITPESVSAARGQVSAQLDRLGIPGAALSHDWVGEPFVARTSNAIDLSLELVSAALARAQLSIASAAAQLAAAQGTLNLPATEVPTRQACVPALRDGFAGTDPTKWTRQGDPANGDDVIGIGGGPGLLRNASVEVIFADGTRLAGARTDPTHGMASLVPCALGAQVPALVRFYGEPGSGASYYDAGRSAWVSFEGEELHGLIDRLEQDRNIAVTPFTEAIYQRVLALASVNTAAGGLALKAVALPWHDAARIAIAHDEVLAAVNDQLPGLYRLSRLDRLPITLGELTDVAGSGALPRTEAGIHGAVLAGLAATAAQNLPDDVAAALTFTHRFAADMADGLLDNPLAGLDSGSNTSLPAYDIDRLWRGITTGTIFTARHAGAAAFATDKPFPLALVHPSGYRNSDMFAQQYIGLFSDGVLRIVAEVRDDDANAGNGPCYRWCDPVRKLRASDTTQWWVFEIARLTDFDADSRIGKLPDGRTVRVGTLSSGATAEQLLQPITVQPVELFPNVRTDPGTDFMFRARDGEVYRYTPPSYPGAPDFLFSYPRARGLHSLAGMFYNPSTSFAALTLAPGGGLAGGSEQSNALHLFGIDSAGAVKRLIYRVQPITTAGVRPPDMFESQAEIALPAPARQLTSDGRLVYALLSSGDVYLLNPDVLATAMRFQPIAGLDDTTAAHLYKGLFAPNGFAPDQTLKLDGASGICRIDGNYLLACDGRLLLIDRVNYWAITGIGFSNLRAPGAEYTLVQDTRFSATGWRAFKAPMSVDYAWDSAMLRLMAATDGTYVLRSDTWGVRAGDTYGGAPQSFELSQTVVESWFAGGAP